MIVVNSIIRSPVYQRAMRSLNIFRTGNSITAMPTMSPRGLIRASGPHRFAAPTASVGRLRRPRIEPGVLIPADAPTSPFTLAPGIPAKLLAVTWSASIVVLMNSHSSTVQFFNATIPVVKRFPAGNAITSPQSLKPVFT
jgi:hypothetical protein